jgi:ParB-like chromosome segregation protein Spo0J
MPTQCDPDDIIVGKRLRPLNAERLVELERSIAAIGLQHPITVRYVIGGIIALVAGHHRLQAVKNLGWSEVPVREFDGTEREARMWEIAENLHRAELTALERSEQLAEWIRLKNEQSAQLASVSAKGEPDAAQVDPHQPRKAGQQPGGINAASRELGVERKAAQRAVKIDSLTPEAKAAAVELGLDDNQSALLEAAKVKSVGEQVAALQSLWEQRQSARLQATANVSEGPEYLQPIISELKKINRRNDRSFIYNWVNTVWFHRSFPGGLTRWRDFKDALGQFTVWYAGLTIDEQLQIKAAMGDIEAITSTPIPVAEPAEAAD